MAKNLLKIQTFIISIFFFKSLISAVSTSVCWAWVNLSTFSENEDDTGSTADPCNIREHIVACQAHPTLVKQVKYWPVCFILMNCQSVYATLRFHISLKDKQPVSRRVLEPRRLYGDPASLACNNIFEHIHIDLFRNALQSRQQWILLILLGETFKGGLPGKVE